MSEPSPTIAAITADLKCRWRRRWRAWGVWTVIELAAIAALLAMVHPRADLWTRGGWRVALELAGWVVALAALPLLALGLWHPAAAVRTPMIVGTVIALTLAATGGVAPLHAGAIFGDCGLLVGLAGLTAAASLVLAGAAAPDRSRAAPTLLAFAVAATAFLTATWVCPLDAWTHVVLGHWLPAGLLAGVVAVWVRARRGRARPGFAAV